MDKPTRPPPKRPGELDLEAMAGTELEHVLIDMLSVKYPGIEQTDVERFFQALGAGNLDLVLRIEADMAQKSAEWKLAGLNLEG
jgi:hypothetical protein